MKNVNELEIWGGLADRGQVYTVGYNAFERLKDMFDVLALWDAQYLIDVRSTGGRVSVKQLMPFLKMHGMTYLWKPELGGKPYGKEMTRDGFADYRVMGQRPKALETLRHMSNEVKVLEKRFALMCACEYVCECHRTNWLATVMWHRGIECLHLYPDVAWQHRLLVEETRVISEKRWA